MSRPACILLMAVLAASLCGCGGGNNDSAYQFGGDWSGAFSDSRVSSAVDLSLDVIPTNPLDPPNQRSYTFTGTISATTEGPPPILIT